jgi:hypothetical protein
MAYQSAVNGERPRTPGEAAHGTLGWLFDLYRQISAWTDLAQSTHYKREQIIMRVLETAGHELVSAITEAHVIAGRERRSASPSSAQAFLDTLHRVFKWAVKSKLAKIDPTLNVKVETKPNRRGGYPPWTDDDMAKFEARWARRLLRRPEPRASAANRPMACASGGNAGCQKWGNRAGTGGYFRLVRGVDGDPLHAERQPQQACSRGHRQVRSC